ncbi:site-specific DNA-methyltransferase [Yoonia sp. GPGPB17]|uniref:DNA-methyltransferase n=1 Tax=Yoonia sp. GPGPB17 TaxID=3026147 RepID=UPI0030C62950
MAHSVSSGSSRSTHRHEHVFHLAKQNDYYFDADAIRIPSKKARLAKGEVVTATGISPPACKERIKSAASLTETQKMNAVDNTFAEIKAGRLYDFRLILKGGNRVTHSDNETISARASRLQRDGFYILRYNPKGSMPGDVWQIAPDRSTGRSAHYAAFPKSIAEVPLKATCPTGGIVLDPFVGTGTTLVAAQRLGRHGIGIDLSAEYLQIARERLGLLS